MKCTRAFYLILPLATTVYELLYSAATPVRMTSFLTNMSRSLAEAVPQRSPLKLFDLAPQPVPSV